MGSISAFSVCSKIELPGPKFSGYNVRPSPKFRFTMFRKNYNPTSKSLIHSISKHFNSHIHDAPFSNLSESDKRCFPALQRNSSNYFVEKLVGFLVWLFIFMGCFNVRHVVALPAQTSGKSPTMDEDSEEEMRERILEHDSRNIDTLKAVLYGKMSSGKTEEAIKYVLRLIDLEPDEVEWRLLLALCYEKMGELEMAKGLFVEILEKNPLLVRALHGLALVMHKNNEGQSVFEMLNKALDIARDHKKVTEQRSIGILIAQMHVVKGELEEGLKKFQELVEENPRDFRPYLCQFLQGIIYSLLDRKEEAAEQFETYRALVPDEFPQREFMDDVMLSATTATREQFQKEFDAEFSYKK
ncbi:protein SLOW GREEN 1, chloroplastic isoform X1 [Cucurbita moschata]|uniref:Protein SLOW GREEN 1, chloroplastic isoform X1 n=1 Tax=Cucurbita moschata TaxID=3662 RepID=A0A6J1HGW9_CUCMO|nr:protein SLOW GREEN 1, chloroplastic isoform X1 [Cucurbita moschata]